ncbi:DUF397 domain-containing protein [Nocardiopsis sp. N85]|uniref:DUF397 domain-containing protein n=1 Tax=Nocardiopsis sp. N85 TaxID=3029400 RepID=UPI00237FB4F0|nr:DUF397 domain-containing protein [Nocardiopsis sp. N85]MDE3721785.1 DUF397 domain-containing protein [Nocardiopsis sp. N85]
MTNTDEQWRKSSYSKNQGQCVEVAELGRCHAVRDSQHPELGHLDFSSGEWFGLLTPIKQHPSALNQ